MKQTPNSAAKSERLTITLAAGQRKKIELIANKHLTSAATVIRWAVDDYIEAKDVSLRGRSKPK
jgi:hypothetical protein